MTTSTLTLSTPWPQWSRWMLRALGAALACVAAGCASPHLHGDAPRAADEVPAGIVSVTYADPARFGSARGAPPETEAARKAWLDALSVHLADRAAPLLAEGQRLEVHLTDVQRAGGFEPWRGPQAADVRIVRDIYPPHIDLTFTLRDAQGQPVREGHRALRDTTFMMHPNRYATDPLRYEKTLVDDWLRQEFGRQG